MPDQWQPIETAPKDERDSPKVDLWVVNTFPEPRDWREGYGERIADARWVDGAWCTLDLESGGWEPSVESTGPYNVRVATHWMPLPLPPGELGRV